MKHILFSVGLAGILSAGCGGSEEDELPTASSMTAVTAADPLGMPTSAKGENVAVNPANLIPKPPETMIDLSTVERPTDDNGKILDDLGYLNHLVFNLNEGRSTYVSDVIPEFRNDDERQQYELALAKAREPIKDLNELVRLKVIKALPQAPAGKQYAINATSGKVELVNQQATTP
jgi:hypothetical protein